MKSRSLILLASAACFGATGCESGSQGAATNHDAEVRAAMENFLTALNALDVAAIDTMFTEDVSAFVPTVQGYAVKGRAEMRTIFAGYAARFPDGPPPPTVPQDVVVTASDSLGVFSFVVPDSARGIVRRRTFVFRRADTGWRIAHYHASDFTAPIQKQ